MGKILASRRKMDNESKIILEVEVDSDEARMLQGNYDDIHVISEKVADFESNIATRGRNSATKYFLIPRRLRDSMNYSNLVNCQRIDTKEKTLFVYVIDKNMSNGLMTRIR
ncbi:MAG: hypothetical protein ACOC32_01765 [Nanoarchaeota archaeon]